jgi:hypothetical protein
MSESLGARINVTRRSLLRGTLAVSAASAMCRRRAVARRRAPDGNVSSNERDLIRRGLLRGPAGLPVWPSRASSRSTISR